MPDKNEMKFYGAVMLSVTECIVTILAFLFFGKWLDGRMGTGSRFLSVGAILGSIIGLIRMSVRLKKISDQT